MKIAVSTKALKKAESRLRDIELSISSVVEEFAAHAAGKFTSAGFLHAAGHEDTAPVALGKELTNLITLSSGLGLEIQAAKLLGEGRPSRVEGGWVWIDGLILSVVLREWKHYTGGPSSMSYIMRHEWHTPYGVIVVS